MNVLFTLLAIAIPVFFWIQYFKTRKKGRNAGKNYKKQLQHKMGTGKNLNHSRK